MKKRVGSGVLPLGVFVCTIAGCVSSGTKVTADQQSAFQVGTTTEAQVVAKLGPHNTVATLADGSKMDNVYAHCDLR